MRPSGITVKGVWLGTKKKEVDEPSDCSQGGVLRSVKSGRESSSRTESSSNGKLRPSWSERAVAAQVGMLALTRENTIARRLVATDAAGLCYILLIKPRVFDSSMAGRLAICRQIPLTRRVGKNLHSPLKKERENLSIDYSF